MRTNPTINLLRINIQEQSTTYAFEIRESRIEIRSISLYIVYELSAAFRGI